MSASNKPQHAKGFTLLELMVTIIIVVILGALAIPSMTTMMLKHRVQDAATDMFTTLFKARSEALRRVENVKARSTNVSADWTGGWQLIDTASKVLDEHQPTQRMTITPTPANLVTITYNASGRVACAPSACATGPKFEFTVSNGGYACTYTVSVDPTGRPYETSRRGSGTDAATGGGVPSC
jgi:type IV fimbrial biogenesis protein FimT